MHFEYDDTTGEYVLGSKRFSKEEFIDYVRADLLVTALLDEKGSFKAPQNPQSAIKTGNKNFTSNYEQIIFYGVPGSGKSFKIDKKTTDTPEDNKIRVVFHPDYTNADFVGQILPKSMGGDVKYEFRPGPFSKILWRAIRNPEKNHFLIIEEINRGNAAAIFGDIFQLLDRINKKSDLEGDNKNLDYGWSKYFIENDYLNNYIRSDVEYDNPIYTENHGKLSFQITDKINFSQNSGIRLPPNLSILATMNTSDQNVFTLDNAFQRRWNMELVSNELKEDSEQYKLKIEGSNISWGKFREEINSLIADQSDVMGISSMEDSQLGAYFIQADKDSDFIKAKDFASKVLKYLWDDAFKLNRSKAFKNKDSFEKSIMQYIPSEEDFKKDSNSKIEFDKILSQKLYQKLYNLESEEDTDTEDINQD